MLMKYRLFTPGPTSVPPETLLELARPVTHHRTAEFRAMFNELQLLLQYVFQTQSTVYTITGSGTAAFEAGFTSCVAPGMRVLNVTNGKFAERWASYAKTYSCPLTEIKLPYGQHVTPELMAAELKKGHVDAVVLVHSETSTATVADLKNVAKVVREVGGDDTLLIVDGITSIGALPFQMDDWGVDVAITGSQKSLMLPPGLGFVALSDRAWRKAAAGKHINFYFDLTKYKKSMEDGDTPFTPANTLIAAQAVSLKMIRDETLETVWKRTATSAKAFRDGMVALGLETKHNIHVAGGQGSMEGQLFRVNHMGYSDAYDALAVVAAIEHVLKGLGHPVELGKGLTAAQRVLAELF
jgi:aspartate aminotransferase-like enzyme